MCENYAFIGEADAEHAAWFINAAETVGQMMQAQTRPLTVPNDSMKFRARVMVRDVRPLGKLSLSCSIWADKMASLVASVMLSGDGFVRGMERMLREMPR